MALFNLLSREEVQLKFVSFERRRVSLSCREKRLMNFSSFERTQMNFASLQKKQESLSIFETGQVSPHPYEKVQWIASCDTQTSQVEPHLQEWASEFERVRIATATLLLSADSSHSSEVKALSTLRQLVPPSRVTILVLWRPIISRLSSRWARTTAASPAATLGRLAAYLRRMANSSILSRSTGLLPLLPAASVGATPVVIDFEGSVAHGPTGLPNALLCGVMALPTCRDTPPPASQHPFSFLSPLPTPLPPSLRAASLAHGQEGELQSAAELLAGSMPSEEVEAIERSSEEAVCAILKRLPAGSGATWWNAPYQSFARRCGEVEIWFLSSDTRGQQRLIQQAGGRASYASSTSTSYGPQRGRFTLHSRQLRERLRPPNPLAKKGALLERRELSSDSSSSHCPCEEVLSGECFGRSDCLPLRERPAEGTLELVVAHCRRSMPWLHNLSYAIRQRGGWQLSKVHIRSKCGPTPEARAAVLAFGAEHRVEISFLEEPNIGRCDYTWASFIAEQYHMLPDRLLFLKDSWIDRQSFRGLSAHELLRRSAGGFACAYQPKFVWHSMGELHTFQMDNYDKEWSQTSDSSPSSFPAAKRPYGRWFHSLRLPSQINQSRFWPICYGGGFATSRAAIHRVPQHTWARIVRSLSRGNNIEESHFMERTWAGLLNQPLHPARERVLECIARSARRSELFWFRGGLAVCNCTDVAKCRNAGSLA
ncbi:MAG: hypothetical protein SGPRY_002694 [Prymnesium sp.]